MSTPRAPLLALALALPLPGALACAEGERYDTATKGSMTIGQISSASQGAASEGESSSSSGGADVSSGAVSESGDATGGPTGDPTTAPGTTSTSTTSTGPTGAPVTTDDGCGGPCDTPPSSCYDLIGECSGDTCLYYPLDEGTACDDGDPCTEDDACDALGACAGAAITCAAPAHATGGACVDGACTGFKCTAPYENCDGEWANGCEVPTGVAHQCDEGGLNPDAGCWTAFCGSLDDPKAKNFGDYYCYDCSTCKDQGGGEVSWCNHSTGNWYPQEAGGCGMWLDLTCEP